MKAAVYHGKGDLRVEEIPVPEPGREEVLVKVKACGVCGTDVHIYDGAKGAAECVPPTVLGHEFSGVVAAVGDGVSGISVGERVAVDPNRLCGSCRFCRNGQGNFCENMKGTGTTCDGGFSEYCAVHQSQIYKISDTLSFEEAAMAEPVSCCLHGMDLAGVKPGSTVLIFGAGPIGMIMLQLAKCSGATVVIIVEPVESKRRLAISLGAALAMSPDDDINAILSKNGIKYIDNVFECVGSKRSMEDSIRYAGRHTTVVLFGLTEPDCEIPIKPFELFQKEIKITASYINPYTMGRAVSLIESGTVKVKPVIAGCVPLKDINSVFENPESRKNGKIIVLP